ncbi:MAG: hypothetical protein Ta2A_24050 [Treponemataceae bacterium]|nr:MAG: hypothetical protein Ta2A_24050 [Treponemataceae bacterium]
MNTARSRDAARAEIAMARELYPEDERFLLCFFVHELSKTDYRTDEAARDYAKEYVDAVMQSIIQSDNDDAELTIYAAAFAYGQERIRLLKSFHARGLSHPLYAIFALEDSLIDSDEAFEYFTNEIAKNGSIEKTLLEVFFSRLQDPLPPSSQGEMAASGALTPAAPAAMAIQQNPPVPSELAVALPSVVEKAKKYLRDFSSTIFEDTDNDGIENMRVLYERGRPLFAEYDSNQDGSAELQVQCDYGTPKTAALSKNENLVQLVYGAYPYIKSARMNGIDFEFPNARLAWYPLDLYVSAALFDSSLNASFYIGQKNNTADMLSERMFFASASRVTAAISESASGHKNAKAVFSFLRGKPLRAEYFSGNKMYAVASFENGIIKNRSVDTTGDGIFDVTEEFGYNEVTARKYFKSAAEKDFLYQELFGQALFGNVAAANGVYVAKVARDTTGDRINDYIEEFAPDSAGNIVKTCYWDNDADGKWDCGYKTRQATLTDTTTDTLTEAITEAFFRSYEIGSTKAVITRIFSENGVPYRVVSDKGEYAVTFDRENGFYWLGAQSANRNDSTALANAFSGELAFQYGCAIVISTDGTKLMARHIAQYKFGELLE